ncbi:hypothetical protein SAMN04488542_101309 [Fontibacillus panacisegetis]|uniref:Uncharacterized protein n=1 Tax=Fontibacillus panacisegetis TaxID=670482 RepID=A0A1G7ES75_9BACL|nr:hypothetical protein [Fontibacillus panacisegetis]SDE66265.1 hypothetical protein SAMN04488542_101309 [Fontibacillus panacisegetis]
MQILKRIAIIFISLVVVIIGTLYFLDEAKYTSFQKEILDELHKDGTLKITIMRYSDYARISITDKELVGKIFNDLSSVELKKVKDFSSQKEYAVRIYQYENLGFEVTKDLKYIVIFKGSGNTKYKVLNDNNYLKTIKNLDLQITE